jgi:hypothetical protein
MHSMPLGAPQQSLVWLHFSNSAAHDGGVEVHMSAPPAPGWQ